jgi:hypothetical protein
MGYYSPGPKMTAFQIIRLSAHGAPEMPPGGSVDNLLKSRISLRFEGVDCTMRNILVISIPPDLVCSTQTTHHFAVVRSQSLGRLGFVSQEKGRVISTL